MFKIYAKYIEDLQCFNVYYGLYFTSGTGFLLFSLVQTCPIFGSETLSVIDPRVVLVDYLFHGESLRTQDHGLL